jgi:integrase/recombinase XerD
MMAKTKPSWPDVTGPLAEYADGFRAELARLGYTPLTAAGQLRLMARLSRWLSTGGLDVNMYPPRAQLPHRQILPGRA